MMMIGLHSFLVSGFWFLVSGFWFLVSGFWFLVSGFWFLVSGFWFLVSGFWFLVRVQELVTTLPVGPFSRTRNWKLETLPSHFPTTSTISESGAVHAGAPCWLSLCVASLQCRRVMRLSPCSYA